MKTGDEVLAVAVVFLVGFGLGFCMRAVTLDYEEDCHVSRHAPDKEARHCKLRYKEYKD